MKTIIFSFFLISITAHGAELPSHCKDLTRAEFERQVNERLSKNKIFFDAKSYESLKSKPECDADKIELNYEDFYFASCKIKPVEKTKNLSTIYCADYRSYKNYCSVFLLSSASDSECFLTDTANILNEAKCYFKQKRSKEVKEGFECHSASEFSFGGGPNDSSSFNECFISANQVCRKKKTFEASVEPSSSTKGSPSSGSRFDKRRNGVGTR